MKAYVITSGGIFGVLTIAHLLRIAVEHDLVTNRWYILITLASAGLCIWAGWLLLRSNR